MQLLYILVNFDRNLIDWCTPTSLYAPQWCEGRLTAGCPLKVTRSLATAWRTGRQLCDFVAVLLTLFDSYW